MNKQWFLLVYDIRDDKRLRRLHYLIKKEGIAVQRSVFLVHVDQEQLDKIRKIVKKQTATLVDDVRLYPLQNPDTLWMAGIQQAALSGLYNGDKAKPKKGFLSLIKTYFNGAQ